MEQNDEIIIEPQIPVGKVYTDKGVWMGVFIGGPLAGGYLIAENYRCFGQRDKVMRTWLISVLATVILFTGAFFIDPDKVPRYIIPLLISAIAYSITQYYQGKQIKMHLSTGGLAYTRWRAALIGIISCLVTLMAIYGVILLLPA